MTANLAASVSNILEINPRSRQFATPNCELRSALRSFLYICLHTEVVGLFGGGGIE